MRVAASRSLPKPPRITTRYKRTAGGILVPQGLDFTGFLNESADSDIGLDWEGSNMVPRLSHTLIWKAYYVQQSGYYALMWHVFADNVWHGGSGEYGTHPYPCDGAVNGTGYATGGTGSVGTVHYHEIANGLDKISNGGSPLLVVKNTWLTQARTCETSGSNYIHTFWPDIDGNPSFSIGWTTTTPPNTATYGAMKFRLGVSPWTASGTTNGETPGCICRFVMQFDQPLVLSDIQAEAANETINAAVTSAGAASIWYCNKNIIPFDVVDKQTQRTQHSPNGPSSGWANARRPAQWG